MAKDGLRDQFNVIGGFISPVNDAYGKKGLVSATHRVNMCKLAVKDSDWIDVDEWEATQPNYTTTLLVLKSFKERLEKNLNLQMGARIMLLAGSDLVESFKVPGLWLEEDVNEMYLCVLEKTDNGRLWFGHY